MKNIVEPYRPQMTIRGMRIACWILKAAPPLPPTHTHYVTLTSFPLQQFARTLLNITLYVHCLSCYYFAKASIIKGLRGVANSLTEYFSLEFHHCPGLDSPRPISSYRTECIFVLNFPRSLRSFNTKQHHEFSFPQAKPQL